MPCTLVSRAHDEQVIILPLLLSKPIEIGRNEIERLSPPGEHLLFVSRVQIILHADPTEPTRLLLEARGVNPTGLHRVGSDTWERLLCGETHELCRGDVIAVHKKFVDGTVFRVEAPTDPTHSQDALSICGVGVADALLSTDSLQRMVPKAGECAHCTSPHTVPAQQGACPTSDAKRSADTAEATSVEIATSSKRTKIDDIDAFFASCRLEGPVRSCTSSSRGEGCGLRTSIPPASNKDRQTWTYPGFKILRSNSVYINGTRYLDPKELPKQLPRRRRESNFLVTINPNKMVPPDLEEVAATAMDIGLKSFSDALGNGECLTFGPKNPEAFGSDQYRDVIIGTPDFKPVTEVGPKLGRLHAHVIIKVDHYSEIQLAIPKIQATFKRAYNTSLALARPPDRSNCTLWRARVRNRLEIGALNKSYVNVELLPEKNHSTIMMQYLHKGNPSACPSTCEQA